MHVPGVFSMHVNSLCMCLENTLYACAWSVLHMHSSAWRVHSRHMHVPGVFSMHVPGVFSMHVPGVFSMHVPGVFSMHVPGVFSMHVPGVFSMHVPGV